MIGAGMPQPPLRERPVRARRLVAATLVLSALQLTRVATAEQLPVEDDPVEEETSREVVIVAQRLPEDEFTSVRSVSVVDAEALWDAPDVFVQQTNRGGGRAPEPGSASRDALRARGWRSQAERLGDARPAVRR
jgi:outer membrane receptor protein involved in Fe transport